MMQAFTEHIEKQSEIDKFNIFLSANEFELVSLCLHKKFINRSLTETAKLVTYLKTFTEFSVVSYEMLL